MDTILGREEEGRRGLALLGGWTIGSWRQFLDSFSGDLDKFWGAGEEAVRELTFLTGGQKKRLLYLHNHGEAELVEAVRSWPGKILLFDDEDYPPQLHDMSSPPLALHVLGRVEALHIPGIAVVGSRKIGAFASQIARELLQGASRRGGNIISGGALGADALAHQVAINSGGVTVAVLPSGLEQQSPSSNRQLFQEIIDRGGALISEYAPNQKVRNFHFPRRNQIIAALGRGVFVLRAKERSGTMLTVEAARKMGRPLAAMPGEPQNPLSPGCHEVIRGGGELIARAEHLDEWWRQLAPELASKAEVEQEEPVQQMLLRPGCAVLDVATEILDEQGTFSLERLAGMVEQAPAELQAIIFQHELAGWVEPVVGGERYRFRNS